MEAEGFDGLDIDQYGIDEEMEGVEDMPHVSIDGINERVPEILNDPETHKTLSTLLPERAFPPPPDFGLGAYSAVLNAIDTLTSM